jgi:membrane-bound metal-dependent hydrolase YbcI (DUF457 family)
VFILLLLGLLPDIDLIMGGLGIEHRTMTHSIFVWSIIFGPFLVRYQKSAIPYFVAVLQHIIFGDLVVGKVSLLWPLTDFDLGTGIRIMSVENLVLEGSGLVIFLLWTFLEKGRKTLFIASSWGFSSLILVVISLAAFSIFALIGDEYISTIGDYSKGRYLERALETFFASNLLPIIAAMHLILLSILLVPLVLTIRFLANKSSNKNARVKA